MRKADSLPPSFAVITQSGSLNFLEPSGHLGSVMGLIYLYLLPAYEDGTECSETSAYKIQMPTNYTEERKLHSEQGEIFKQRKLFVCLIYSVTAKKFMYLIIFSCPLLLHNSRKKTYELYNVLNMKLEMKDSILKRNECARQHK